MAALTAWLVAARKIDAETEILLLFALLGLALSAAFGLPVADNDTLLMLAG